ncbi:JmjC domain, hydroxylase-domain-containing protein [Phycomyces nitens]|nr:JmjC domain, hydroxylase-domain-containing protein [Phycomyces nitens]
MMPGLHIAPSEYYDQDNGSSVPVFRPTMEQFEDFGRFMEAVDSHGRKAGIVKVIPPKEWKDQLTISKQTLGLLRVKNPIAQYILGSKGCYSQTNVENNRFYTLPQWSSFCQEDVHRPPLVSQTGERQRKMVFSHVKKTGTCSSNILNAKQSAFKRKNILELKRQHKQTLANEKRLANSHTPHLLDPSELPRAQHSTEYYKEIERIYWRNLTFMAPYYGADIHGSLFNHTAQGWNLNNLDNVLRKLRVSIPGVTTPYLYFGMWKSTFPWHLEDMDLYSINYIHFGAPKQWYVVPPAHRTKFEGVMKSTFHESYRNCKEFIRHKTSIMSPQTLANHAIPVNRCVQHEGEFMITFPYGYHSGYNLDFNCAESVNFALDSWLDIGRQAKACKCVNDSVQIDVGALGTEPCDERLASQIL